MKPLFALQAAATGVSFSELERHPKISQRTPTAPRRGRRGRAVRSTRVVCVRCERVDLARAQSRDASPAIEDAIKRWRGAHSEQATKESDSHSSKDSHILEQDGGGR